MFECEGMAEGAVEAAVGDGGKITAEGYAFARDTEAISVKAIVVSCVFGDVFHGCVGGMLWLWCNRC